MAVEPLPVDALREICDQNGIALIEGCLSDIDGFQSLYIGTFAGAENLNLSSLVPDWWGASTEHRRVGSLTLSTLLSSINAQT
ncbi:MAG: methyltransferase, partial [Anaerolineae bacterium]